MTAILIGLLTLAPICVVIDGAIKIRASNRRADRDAMRRYEPRPRRLAVSDAGLRCFVQWCRLNSAEVTGDVVVARRALEAYAGVASRIDPGVGLAEAQP